MDIYQYDDHRLYLRDAYRKRKNETPGYTHRRFAEEADIANPGYLNDVIKGRRPLSMNAARKFSRALELDVKEEEYFFLLVEYSREKDAKRREDIHHRIVYRRNRSHFAQANPAAARYYEDIRYPLVRNAIEVLDFRGDYDQLCRFLDIPATVSEMKRIIRDLCEWGLLEQRSDGRYVQTSEFVEPCSTLFEQVRRLNRQWIFQAAEALKRYNSDKRHVSSQLLTVSPDAEKKIMEKIEQFRRDIFAIAANDRNQTKVMQLNCQFFPQSGDARVV